MDEQIRLYALAAKIKTKELRPEDVAPVDVIPVQTILVDWYLRRLGTTDRLRPRP